MNNPVIIGRFGRAHGVKGWLRVFSFTDPEINILDLFPWHIKTADGWQEIKIEDSKVHHQEVVVKIANIDDREIAKKYTNKEIAVYRAQLPNLAKGEYYWHDLIGVEVINKSGHKLGKVTSLFATGANDVLVVKNNREILIPYTKDVITNVDLKHKTITVDWEKDYL